MTVMPGPQLTEAVPICRELKRRFPELVIIWGGYFTTLHPGVVMPAEFVDFGLIGHAEHSFRTLVDRLTGGDGRRDDIPGLLWKSADGEVHENGPGPVPDLGALPDWPYHRVPVKDYLRPTFLGSRTLPHHSSYGCPFKCNFCAVVNMVGGRYSSQSAERLAGIIGGLVREHGVNAIEMHDNNFFVEEARVAEYCDRTRHLGLGWWGFGRIDTMMKFSDSTWAAMRDSGLRMVFMGAESGADETLRRMNKGGKQTAAQALEIAARMKRFGIVPEMSFIFGNPPDPAADIRQTMGFIRRLKKINPATEIVFYIYTPVPVAGDLYSAARASGFEYPTRIDDWVETKWVEFVQHRTADLPWLDARLKTDIRNFQRVLHATYPTVTDPALTGLRRFALRTAGWWRYQLRFYGAPYDLRLMHRLLPFQRPETSGF